MTRTQVSVLWEQSQSKYPARRAVARVEVELINDRPASLIVEA